MWTPLVMWPMGISSSARHGQRWAHIRRRDVAVQVAHGVGPPRELQPQHGHAEGLVLVLRLDAAQAHQLLEGDAQLVAQRARGAPRSGCGRSGRGRRGRACAW